MCTEVELDGELLTSLGELRAALGREPVYVDPAEWYSEKTPGEYCLCGVNHSATAALLGRVLDRSEWGDVVYAKPDPREEG